MPQGTQGDTENHLKIISKLSFENLAFFSIFILSFSLNNEVNEISWSQRFATIWLCLFSINGYLDYVSCTDDKTPCACRQHFCENIDFLELAIQRVFL